MSLNNFIHQFHNAFNLNIVSTVIKYANNVAFQKAQIGKDGIVDENIRKVALHPLRADHKLLSNVHWSNYFNYHITSYMNHYLKLKNFKYNSNINGLNQIELLKYTETNHYDFHIDGDFNMHRTLSSILFLNNDYENGELCFKNPINNDEFIIKPYCGSLVIFPSNMFFPHSVKPISKGIRYTIVAWA